MSRVEQTGRVMEFLAKKVEEKPSGTFEEMTVWHLGTIGTVLSDIAISLAIIADKMASRTGAEKEVQEGNDKS